MIQLASITCSRNTVRGHRNGHVEDVSLALAYSTGTARTEYRNESVGVIQLGVSSRKRLTLNGTSGLKRRPVKAATACGRQFVDGVTARSGDNVTTCRHDSTYRMLAPDDSHGWWFVVRFARREPLVVRRHPP